MELFTMTEREEKLIGNIENEPFVHIKATKSTPEIILNKERGTMVFQGRSLPENPLSFYEPIQKWIADYLENPSQETLVKFDTDYFNTASSKVIKDIISMFKEAEADNITVEWHYQIDDEDTLEAGEEIAELVNIDLKFVSYLDN